MTAEPNE